MHSADGAHYIMRVARWGAGRGVCASSGTYRECIPSQARTVANKCPHNHTGSPPQAASSCKKLPENAAVKLCTFGKNNQVTQGAQQ